MITSTYGVKLPEDGDQGAPLFAAISENFEYLRDHSHDGTDGVRIASTAISKGEVTISTPWTTVSNGFKQTITCPGSATLANSTFKFYVTSGGDFYKEIHPTIVPISITQFDVIVNDSTLNLKVLFI